MNDIQRAIETQKSICDALDRSLISSDSAGLVYIPVDRMDDIKTAISAMQELQQYRERIEQLKHAEVIQFRCKLPDGRICHFSDFIKFLEKGEVD